MPAALLRCAIVLAPGLAAVATVGMLARIVPAPTTDAPVVGLARVGLLVLVASVVAYGVERAVRRLTPLVMLLQMSLLFPAGRRRGSGWPATRAPRMRGRRSARGPVTTRTLWPSGWSG